MRDRLQQAASENFDSNSGETLEFEMIAAGGGVFEIVRDGELVYSKKALNRFPEDAEVDAIIPKS